jgi:hypothetical protein
MPIVAVMLMLVIMLMVVAVTHARAPCGSAATSCLAAKLSIASPAHPD